MEVLVVVGAAGKGEWIQDVLVTQLEYRVAQITFSLTSFSHPFEAFTVCASLVLYYDRPTSLHEQWENGNRIGEEARGSQGGGIGKMKKPDYDIDDSDVEWYSHSIVHWKKTKYLGLGDLVGVMVRPGADPIKTFYTTLIFKQSHWLKILAIQ